jgi:hypothetical protein
MIFYKWVFKLTFKIDIFKNWNLKLILQTYHND